jgi:hypothetical protein
MEAVMMKNIGGADRLIRVLLALGIGVLYFTGQIAGTLAIILGFLAVIFLLTSFISVCPLYLPFSFSTRKNASRG